MSKKTSSEAYEHTIELNNILGCNMKERSENRTKDENNRTIIFEFPEKHKDDKLVIDEVKSLLNGILEEHVKSNCRN